MKSLGEKLFDACQKVNTDEFVPWKDGPEDQKTKLERIALAFCASLSDAPQCQPVNKAPHHMSEEETEVIRLCDEYEAIRNLGGRLFEQKTSLIAHTLAEHFALIRRAIHRAGAEDAAIERLEAMARE